MAGLVERGTMGRLVAPGPVLAPLVWTTVATGHRADKHGVLVAEEFDPGTGRVAPVSRSARRTEALWTITARAGLRTHAVNRCASHPAEPLTGICVSDRLPLLAGRLGHDALRPDDPEARRRLAELGACA